jgi:hypothetical protein
MHIAGESLIVKLTVRRICHCNGIRNLYESRYLGIKQRGVAAELAKLVGGFRITAGKTGRLGIAKQRPRLIVFE